MRPQKSIIFWIGLAVIGTFVAGDALAQRGGGGRSGGHRSGGGMSQPNRGPSMSRPGGMQGGMQRPGGMQGGMQRPGGAGNFERPGGNANFERPGGAGNFERPGGGAGRPGGEAGFQRPGGGGGAAGFQRPEGGMAGGRPGATSDQLSDFLGGSGGSRPGMQQRPGGQAGYGQRPNVGNTANVGNNVNAGNRENIGNRTNVGNVGDRTNVGNVGDRNRTTNINTGDINVGNRSNYADNRDNWMSQRNGWGNDVRGNVGNRYGNVFNDDWYRRPYAGAGYNYWGGWANRGPYYAWSPAAWSGVGAFMGGAMAAAQPMYYGYGTGGNVYYENNAVYVNGQPAGTPQQYFQQTQAIAASAPPPDQTNPQDEWLPLGVYAVTSEDAPDSSIVLQLAVNKQGVLAGTLHNDQTKTDRPVQGKVDQQSQKAVLSFGDGKNSDRILETGIYNLTKDEAPALLHFGADQAQPMLLVRLKPPTDQADQAPAPGE